MVRQWLAWVVQLRDDDRLLLRFWGLLPLEACLVVVVVVVVLADTHPWVRGPSQVRDWVPAESMDWWQADGPETAPAQQLQPTLVGARAPRTAVLHATLWC